MRTLRRKLAFVCLLVGLGICEQALALSFNVTYDSSVSSAPSGFTTDFQDAINYYQSTFTNPITIDLNVGWGEVGGSAISSGALGESELSGLYQTSYNGMINLMGGNPGLSSYYTTSPTSNPSATDMFIPTAEMKAMECGSQNAGGTCRTAVSGGAVGFGSSYSWDFSSNTVPSTGQYDFLGVAEHEISEVMGRVSLQDWSGCPAGSSTPPCFAPLDLFRYGSGGTFNPVNGTDFSINGGVTTLNTFNTNSGGDYGDWSGTTLDPFNAFMKSGTLYSVSGADVSEMKVLGYDTPVPLPAAFWLLASGLLVLAVLARRPGYRA